jgi:hypothetical protein
MVDCLCSQQVPRPAVGMFAKLQAGLLPQLVDNAAADRSQRVRHIGEEDAECVRGLESVGCRSLFRGAELCKGALPRGVQLVSPLRAPKMRLRNTRGNLY